MENSLQETAGSFSFSGMKKHAAAISILLFSFSLIPLPSIAEPVCEGDSCEITFSYTGDVQIWTPPSGATNIQFNFAGLLWIAMLSIAGLLAWRLSGK